MDFLMVFITGLTTGGLSCLAVQGGLLASSLANQLEQDLILTGGRRQKKESSTNRQIAWPILLFLLAKLVSYTLLGFLLGALGSMLQLTAFTRAILLMVIGMFMIGNGLRMMNIHPIFRFFVFEPPSFITRFIRRYAKNNSSAITPLFLGAMTVLIPCGVTQSVMAIALGTGSPLNGAGLMFSFTLGTSPVFFTVAYLATRLSASMEKYFMRIVAVIVVILGLVSVDSGLNLAGSPFSISALLTGGNNTIASNPSAASGTPAARGSATLVTIQAKNEGYEPKVLTVSANTPIQLNIVTNNTRSCARAIVFPSLKEERILPVTGTVTLQVPPQPSGTVMRYACSMGMYTGQIVFQ